MPDGYHRQGVHHRARLTPAQVQAIRADHATGYSIRVLARRFSVDRSTIRDIVRAKTWRHLLSPTLAPLTATAAR